MIQFWRLRNIDKQDGKVVFSEEDKKQTQLPVLLFFTIRPINDHFNS
jgi:hypothetical protein